LRRKLGLDGRNFVSSCGLIFLSFLFQSCSISARIPAVFDDRIESLVRDEAARIVEVTEDKENFSQYQIFLSDFPRKDILGMSIGGRRIYINYRLGKLAFRSPRYLWLLRQTLAHEIAHELADHGNQTAVNSFSGSALGRGVTAADVGLPSNVRFHHYSVEKELEADLNGMKYWSKLHWDCRVWVDILETFRQQNYSGDVFHPTDERLRQALRVCPPESDGERMALEVKSAEMIAETGRPSRFGKD
jgi:predicted Zn-dependent protease